MKHETKKYEDDDGRVICNMDVEGMRWHDPRARGEKIAARADFQGEQLTQSESRLYTWYAVLAGLVIVLVFALTWVLFIWFCTEIWLK